MAASLATRPRSVPHAAPARPAKRDFHLRSAPPRRFTPRGAVVERPSPVESERVSLRNQALLAFSIRVASTALAYLSQILLARLLGVEAYRGFSVVPPFRSALVVALSRVAPAGRA
jgi:hypothetical protein